MPALKAVLVTCLLAPSVAFASCIIPAYQATYDVSAGGASGSLVQTLSEHSGGYLFNSITKAHILFFSDTITETSSGDVKAGHIRPLQYKVIDTHENQPFTANFNWQQRSVYTRYAKQHVTLRQLSPQTQDGLSYQLVMRQLLSQGYNKMFHFPVPSLSSDKQVELKSVIFSTPHQEALKTPLGTLQTISVISHEPSQKKTLEYWFAPKFNYLLVQSKAVQGGDTKAMITIRSYKRSNNECVVAG